MISSMNNEQRALCRRYLVGKLNRQEYEIEMEKLEFEKLAKEKRKIEFYVENKKKGFNIDY